MWRATCATLRPRGPVAKAIVIYFEQHVAAAIRHLASECDATNQELGEMAFKFLFEKFESRGRRRDLEAGWSTAVRLA
jgi:hypothetical protein